MPINAKNWNTMHNQLFAGTKHCRHAQLFMLLYPYMSGLVYGPTYPQRLHNTPIPKALGNTANSIGCLPDILYASQVEMERATSCQLADAVANAGKLSKKKLEYEIT
uniref:Uncharacterized protein n=1 Tax=Romanomermis culicivorax TaxID=13658 RepID=A0A915JFK4_ROMCU